MKLSYSADNVFYVDQGEYGGGLVYALWTASPRLRDLIIGTAGSQGTEADDVRIHARRHVTIIAVMWPEYDDGLGLLQTGWVLEHKGGRPDGLIRTKSEAMAKMREAVAEHFEES